MSAQGHPERRRKGSGAEGWQVRTIGGLEADGGTWWSFTVTVPFVAPDHWKAEYFGNETLTGAPVAVVDEGTGSVEHSWGGGGPAGLMDHFSARFTRTVTLAAGTYRFSVTTDDGSRLWVDDQLRIDAWWAQGPTTYTADVALGAGAHTLRYEFFEQTGGATAQLTWAPLLEVPAGEWAAEYFANMTLSGPPASTVAEVSAFVDHPWWDGGPDYLPVDGFSARFTRTLGFPAGTYRFTVVTDDGSRLWVDEQLVIDAWWDQAPTTYTADVGLAAGDHTVRYEFYENTGGAVAQLSWAVATAPGPAAAGLPPAPRPGGGPVAAGALLVAVLGCLVRLARRAGAGVRRRLPATALLLTALLLVPARALAQIPTQVIEYYYTDAIGSVRAVTKQVNGTWQVVARHDFMPFGEEVAPPTPPQDKRLFTGKERDHETGLDYLEARYLNASVGRFTTIDPAMTLKKNLADPQRWNRYAYVENNPLVYVDPDGRSSVKFDGKTNMIYFYDKTGKLVGSWKATNKVDWNLTTIGKMVDGVYYFEDKVGTRYAGGDHDSRLGPDGMFALKPYMGSDGKMHDGVGIHAGRMNKGGWEAWTVGCIRTEEAAIKTMKETVPGDPLTTLTVVNNKPKPFVQAQLEKIKIVF